MKQPPDNENWVDLAVNMKRPEKMKTTMTANDHLGFSNLNNMENMRMKMMHVDLVIVYNETVMNWKLQFDSPVREGRERRDM